MRKTISLVLAVLMMLALLPALRLGDTVSAADEAKQYTYTLVTTAEELETRAKDSIFLMISSNQPGPAKALSCQSGNLRKTADVTVTADKTVELPEDAQAWTADDKDTEKVFRLKLQPIENIENEPRWTFFDPVTNGYLYAPGGGDYLRTSSTQLPAAMFSLTFEADGAITAVSDALDVAQIILGYSDFDSRFSCYETAEDPIFLYACKDDTTIEDPEKPEPTDDTIILFTNDVHCGIRSGWGYAGLAKLKKDLEAAGSDVILIDAGDHIQGGSIGSLTQGEAIIDIMNAVGYDLAVPGNHEFDYGMNQFFALMKQAEYPYLSANFMDLTQNALVLDACKIIEANGKKIAFVGLCTPETITQSIPSHFMNEDCSAYIYGFCQDDTGAGVYTAAQNAIDTARADGADYVIVVGHLGVAEGSYPWKSTDVIANITGADAFISAHSHTVINEKVTDKEGKKVLHGQTGTAFANIGKLAIHPDGTLTMELLPAPEEVENDPEVDDIIKAIENEFNELLESVVAHTDHLLTINDPDTGERAVRNAETNLGDLCADAYRSVFDADVAFVNGGGIRADIPAGDITFRQIIDVHPFGNTAVLAEVSGQQILDALEMGSCVYPGENGGFLQVSGLTYEIHRFVEPNCVVDSNKNWQGPKDANGTYRVQNVQVFNRETEKYEPLDLEKKYTLAGHDYMLAEAGDGFAMFGKNIKILMDSGIPDNKVLIDCIQSMPADADGVHQVTGYTDPKGEGRISIVAPRIYGEDVTVTDISEYINGNTVYHYDIKVADIPADREIVGIQAFIEYDANVLTFLDAASAFDGEIGTHADAGKLRFAWAGDGQGVHVKDGETVVTLNFAPAGPVEDNQVTPITFTVDADGAACGYSYLENGKAVEADEVGTVDGSITFDIPDSFTLVGDHANAIDVMTAENGQTLYRYDIKVKDLPKSGLMINSADIFLTFDSALLAYAKADGPVAWTVTYNEKDNKLMAVWASETEVALHEDDVVLSVFFKAKTSIDGAVEIAFTDSALAFGSAVSVVIGGKVVEIEANTENGSLTFRYLIGDANCDGQVTASDASAILRSLVGLDALSVQGAINADLNCNGRIGADDASVLLRFLVGLIDKLPA